MMLAVTWRRVAAAGLLALAIVAPAASQARMVSTGATGFVIENTGVVPTDPATAWKALVEDVDRWWPADHTWFGSSANLRIDARAGGCFCEIDGERQVMHMTIAFVDPGRLLRMLGGLGPLQGMGMYGALDWKFEAAEGGTRITLRYQASGYVPEDFDELVPVVDRVQGLQLGGLLEYLRTRAGGAPQDRS
jgi:uncharacterized protein YndB with AHSA1/START domain